MSPFAVSLSSASEYCVKFQNLTLMRSTMKLTIECFLSKFSSIRKVLVVSNANLKSFCGIINERLFNDRELFLILRIIASFCFLCVCIHAPLYSPLSSTSEEAHGTLGSFRRVISAREEKFLLRYLHRVFIHKILVLPFLVFQRRTFDLVWYYKINIGE